MKRGVVTLERERERMGTKEIRGEEEEECMSRMMEVVRGGRLSHCLLAVSQRGGGG